MAIVVRFWVIFVRDFWIAASVSLSTAEVASSKIKIGGSLRMARAITSLSFANAILLVEEAVGRITPGGECFGFGFAVACVERVK